MEKIPTASTTASLENDEGIYAITVSGGVDDSYAFSNEPGTLTITDARAKISLSNLEQESDGTAKEPAAYKKLGKSFRIKFAFIFSSNHGILTLP